MSNVWRKHFVASFSIPMLAVVLGCVGTACAQSYPVKPIRIVAGEVGSGNDIVARVVAGGMTRALGQQVLVDNRGSVIAPEIVAKSAPDGYTGLLMGSQMWLAQYLRAKVGYAMTEFTPVSMATTSPGFLVVHPSVAATSVKELIALARAHPGELNYATGSPGAMTHLAPELLKQMAGIDIMGITYRGGGPALAAILAGQVQFGFVSAGGVTPQIRAGKLRGLAVTSAKPSALFPELPTVAASGLPGFEVVALNGLLVPAQTPPAIIKRLNQEMVQALNAPEVKDRLTSSGVEVVASTPAYFADVIKDEMKRLGKLIKDRGIRAE